MIRHRKKAAVWINISRRGAGLRLEGRTIVFPGRGCVPAGCRKWSCLCWPAAVLQLLEFYLQTERETEKRKSDGWEEEQSIGNDSWPFKNQLNLVQISLYETIYTKPKHLNFDWHKFLLIMTFWLLVRVCCWGYEQHPADSPRRISGPAWSEAPGSDGPCWSWLLWLHHEPSGVLSALKGAPHALPHSRAEK